MGEIEFFEPDQVLQVFYLFDLILTEVEYF